MEKGRLAEDRISIEVISLPEFLKTSEPEA